MHFLCALQYFNPEFRHFKKKDIFSKVMFHVKNIGIVLELTVTTPSPPFLLRNNILLLLYVIRSAMGVQGGEKEKKH